MSENLDLNELRQRAHDRIEMPGAPWVTGTQVLTLIRRIKEAEIARDIHSDRRIELETIRDQLEEAIFIAWGIISNASNGDWLKQSDEWVGAAERWRDRYINGRNKDETQSA